MVDFGFLGSVLSQSYSLSENKLHSLDVVKNGRTVPYGKLGDFAKRIDTTAQRSYTGNGFDRTSLLNSTPKFQEQWWMEPDITILVKKRAFSSLAENYRPDLMSEEERLFLRATKFLFQNKCKQIAAYEQLTKIEAVVKSIGAVETYLLPAIFASADLLDSAFSAIGSSAFNKFKSVVDRVRTVVNLSEEQNYTKWWTNVQNSFKTDLGSGTGVIEFTTANSITTTTSVNFGAGGCNITFTDPYQLMRITHNDIEQAIADASNAIYGNSFIELGLNSLNESINSDKKELNQVRVRRGANPINFIIEPDTFLGKRVRAIIDGNGVEIKFEGSVFKVNIDPSYTMPDATPGSVFDAGNIAGKDALTRQEVKLFSSIVKSSFNALQINKNSQTISRAHNAKTNGLRKKLMLHYGGSLVIQPMDVVHVFVSSKTKIDEKILGGLQDSFNALGFLQTANKTMVNLQDFFNAATGNSVEKAIFVGNDFPNWLWLAMRNQFVSDKSGTQIFAGIIEEAGSSYDSGSGSHSVTIKAADNANYFDYGIVNFKPANDVWNGSLLDPVTPFDIKFDSVTGFQNQVVPELLQENKELFNSAFIKFNKGIYVGKKPTTNNFIQDTERAQTNSVRRVFYDPDGMVYKWKEGIGSLVMFGNNYQEDPSTNTSVPPLTKDPFAGQDVMNTLSLLITGEPYNFATFYKAASQFDNFGRDPITGADPSASYFRNLQADLKKRNLIYGDFVPYKKLSMDTESFKTALTQQIRVNGFDEELNTLIAQAADLNDRIAILTNFGKASSVALDPQNLQQQLAVINTKIADKQNQIVDELNKINSPLSIIGKDVSLDANSFLNTRNRNDLSNNYTANKELRRKLHFLTRRMSWKVRANEDVNLFIVDDHYDKDYDIQAFEKSFTSSNLFNSEYLTVRDKITHIKDILDLEVFANTQGHIEIRPPQYNKIPSSVFYRMLRLKKEFDIQLYPQFIEDLYGNQINNAISQIEVIEDQIRMYGLALGKLTDGEISNYINFYSQPINTNSPSASFSFLSDPDSGKIIPANLPDLAAQNAPDNVLSLFSAGLEASNSIVTQAKVNGILSTAKRPDLLKNIADTLKARDQDINSILSNAATGTREENINKRLVANTQQTFDLKQLFPNSAKLSGKISQVDLLKIIEEMTDLVFERQKIIKIAASSISKAKEGISFLKNENQVANKLLIGGSPNNTNIPAALEGLIEDESYDDYGPGSGKRYIIKDAFIKSLSITQKKPPFTMIEVQGGYADNFINASELPGELNGFIGGGNALSTASAIDYDMWRMYGMFKPESIPAPYLTDPKTQCAPFAVALLNKARKQINDGSNVVIFGNEYMQPGEVVYIESLDMLYYVESVNHSISYGKSFSTSLTLRYGHMPGEYIPTYLDIVGKVLYKNKDITNLIHKKDAGVQNGEHIGTIVGNTNSALFSSFNSSQNDIMVGTFGDENRKTLSSILDAAVNVFVTAGSTNLKPILELRIFSASKSGYEISNNAKNLASAVKDYLIGNNNMFGLIKTGQPKTVLAGNADSIKITPVDSNKVGEFRTPSTSAYYMARRAITKKQSGNQNSTDISKLDNIINNYIVDCWIYYENNSGQ